MTPELLATPVPGPQQTTSGRTEFDAVLAAVGAVAGDGAALETACGGRIELAVWRWHAEPDAADERLLARCAGPVLDLGCGPGRLTAALAQRGIPVLGVDVSAVAVRLTRARGGLAVRRDVFGRLPGAGRWAQVLLADGNIGIGGDPVRLLRRVAALLGPAGSALVETEPPGVGCELHTARLSTADGPGQWFPWARVGIDALPELAAAAGLRVRSREQQHGRWFAELTH